MCGLKNLWNSFKIAFAMFSKIPMPQADWSEENMRYMLCFFPFVGAAVGAVTLGGRMDLPVYWNEKWIYCSSTGTCTSARDGRDPCGWSSGYIGCLSSWREREKRLEILKDSHAGAFAVITACVYFMAMYGGMIRLQRWKTRRYYIFWL